jgi:hypothetical protein
MTVAKTPALFGQPASTGLGLFELDPEREASDFMTGFNIAVEKSALSLQEKIEERLGITGSEDNVLHPSGAMEEPWVPSGVTRSSGTIPSAAPGPDVSTAAVTVTSGEGGNFLSGAIQGGIIGLLGAVVFTPKKVVAVASIAALVGGLVGAATSGQQRP